MLVTCSISNLILKPRMFLLFWPLLHFSRFTAGACYLKDISHNYKINDDTEILLYLQNKIIFSTQTDILITSNKVSLIIIIQCYMLILFMTNKL